MVLKEVMILETHLDAHHLKEPAMVFYPDKELNNDPTNWWGPNPACVISLLKCCGFQKVEFTPTAWRSPQTLVEKIQNRMGQKIPKRGIFTLFVNILTLVKLTEISEIPKAVRKNLL